MSHFRFLPLPSDATFGQVFTAILWFVLVAALVAAFIVLLLTKRGRNDPRRVCIVLSLLGHVLLAGYATTIQIAAASHPGPDSVFEVMFEDGDYIDEIDQSPEPQPMAPWQKLSQVDAGQPDVDDLARQTPGVETDWPTPEIPETPQESALPVPQPEDIATNDPLPQPEINPSDTAVAPTPASDVQTLEAPQATRETADVTTVPEVDRPQIRNLLPMSDPGRLDPLAADHTTQSIAPPQLAETPLLDTPDAPQAGLDDISGDLTAAKPAEAYTARTELVPLVRSSSNDTNRNSAQTSNGDVAASPPGETKIASGEPLPTVYQYRDHPRRADVARRRGGSIETEAAVEAGLRWLAQNQSVDGRWDADALGAGVERRVSGNDRRSAGAQADSGISGLTVLTFLGAGHTHLKGDYRRTVDKGLAFLVSQQKRDGDLSGDARTFAAMYCHGMATFALCEAYAMTGDERLAEAVQRAIAFTLAAQDPVTGGWRYRPGDEGDTSQLGWQLMALKSAELAGIEIPEATWQGAKRYLNSVSVGPNAAYASYRPGQRPSAPMTAEALACWQFLGIRDANREQASSQFIVESPPGHGRDNFYYWYYATLAMSNLQNDDWTTWNAALQEALLRKQRTDGDRAGSWDADTVWGGYGGRAYCTAMATMCLESYYRYLPTFKAARSTE